MSKFNVWKDTKISYKKIIIPYVEELSANKLPLTIYTLRTKITEESIKDIILYGSYFTSGSVLKVEHVIFSKKVS